MKEKEALTILEDQVFDYLFKMTRDKAIDKIDAKLLEAMQIVRRMIETREKYGKIIAFKAGAKEKA